MLNIIDLETTGNVGLNLICREVSLHQKEMHLSVLFACIFYFISVLLMASLPVQCRLLYSLDSLEAFKLHKQFEPTLD